MMRRSFSIPALVLACAAFVAGGCERSTDGLRPFPLSTDPIVFEDTFGNGVEPQAFLGSKLDAFSIDTAERHAGTASMKITVPAPGDPSGGYAGGAIVASIVRDLTGYDALTFWAKASHAITLNTAGIGNDNTGTSRFEASRSSIPITTTWTKFVIPIPLPARLSAERGLFFLAEAPELGVGADIWFDEIRFERTGVVTNPRPSMSSRIVTSFVGTTINAPGTQTILSVAGSDVIASHSSAYFDFFSSNPMVATTAGGVIRIAGPGTAAVTAQLGGVPATGTVTVNAIAPPATPAPAPTVPAVDVISLFSNAYANVPVGTWSATWDNADVTDLKVAGDDIKGYTNLVFAGIEFNPINATAMTDFHIDVFLPAGSTVRVKLVDFGADGVAGGGDDLQQDLPFSSPEVSPEVWSSLEIPLSSFSVLTTRAHIGQLLLSGSSTMFVDNVYFHR